MKYSFKNDYSEGAHPNILEALLRNNQIQQQGYCRDDYSKAASDLIREKLGNPKAAVHFVSGGTQANLTVISSILRPYQSVISATTGHINRHETGAIEATGHRIEAIATNDGKLSPELIDDFLGGVEQIHMRQPGIVYVSQSTEVGSHYTKRELETLWRFCKERSLYLFMDGARLASGLDASDIHFSDLGKFTDIFYIGGTKNGALIGEAIVINNLALQTDFEYNLKMRGALLAKSRLLGIQFAELFRDDLYFKIGRHLNQMATRLAQAFSDLGYAFLVPSETNQIFPILPNRIIEKLQEEYDFYVWKKIDGEKAAIRLVTSWATDDSVVEAFSDYLRQCSGSPIKP